MIRECKGLCCKLYPDAIRRNIHYWDMLGFKSCHVCKFLLKADETKHIKKCQCCITKFRTRIRKTSRRYRPTKQEFEERKPGVNYYIDYTKMSCAICGSTKTYFNPRTKRPVWYKLNTNDKSEFSYCCVNCKGKMYYAQLKEKKKQKEQQLMIVLQQKNKK